VSIGHFQTLLVAAALLLTGCAGKAPQSNKAVEDGVLEYLKNRKGLDINSMDVKVNSVTFRGSEADVQVSFTAKGASDTSQPMQMKYVLEQKDGKWTVKGRSNNEHTNTPPPGTDIKEWRQRCAHATPRPTRAPAARLAATQCYGETHPKPLFSHDFPGHAATRGRTRPHAVIAHNIPRQNATDRIGRLRTVGAAKTASFTCEINKHRGDK